MVVDVIELIDTNKAKLAFLSPFLVTLLGVLANWVSSGEFDTTEVRGAIAGVVLAAAAAVGAYFANPGQARIADVQSKVVR